MGRGPIGFGILPGSPPWGMSSDGEKAVNALNHMKRYEELEFRIIPRLMDKMIAKANRGADIGQDLEVLKELRSEKNHHYRVFMESGK